MIANDSIHQYSSIFIINVWISMSFLHTSIDHLAFTFIILLLSQFSQPTLSFRLFSEHFSFNCKYFLIFNVGWNNIDIMKSFFPPCFHWKTLSITLHNEKIINISFWLSGILNLWNGNGFVASQKFKSNVCAYFPRKKVWNSIYYLHFWFPSFAFCFPQNQYLS